MKTLVGAYEPKGVIARLNYFGNEACIACGHRTDDPRYLISGFAGLPHHECPEAFEQGRKNAERSWCEE